MEFPLFVCNNCNFAEKENYILLKGYKIKQYNNTNILDIKKEEYKTSSIDDNNSSSTNQLEIIEYPYNLDFNNEDDSLELNLKAAKMQLEKNLGMYNDDIRNQSNRNIWEEGNNDGTNFKSVTENNSSVIINNEDNISQNKNLLKNLYSNYNNINNKEIKKNKNLIKKNGNKKVKGKKTKKIKKYNSNTKTLTNINHEYNNLHSDKIIGIKVNYPFPDKEIEKFSLEEPKVLNSDKKIKLKNLNCINFEKHQNNSDNKMNYINYKKLGIINNENDNNRKTINVDSEKNLKEKSKKISTDKIYSKFRERLFNDKTNYLKKDTLNKYNKKKRIINKDIYRNKTSYRFNYGNRTINANEQALNNNPLKNYNDNYRKLLLKRIKKENFHYNKTLSNYSMKNYRYSNIFHFKKKNIISNIFMSKTYMNPFDKEKKNLLYDFRFTTLKNSKSRLNKK